MDRSSVLSVISTKSQGVAGSGNGYQPSASELVVRGARQGKARTASEVGGGALFGRGENCDFFRRLEYAAAERRGNSGHGADNAEPEGRVITLRHIEDPPQRNWAEHCPGRL